MNVKYKGFEHIITEQHRAEEQFMAEYQAGNYTFDKPYIKLNPYVIAPLTALVMFETAEPATVSITVKGKEAAGDIRFDFPAAMEHRIPVYGLYADYDNQVELTLGNGAKTVLTIRTEAAPDKVKLPTQMETTAEYFQDNMMFLSPTSPAMTAAYDYKGDVRWYGTLNFAFDIKRGSNGRLLIGTHRLLMPPYHTTGLYEMGMIGKIYKEYRLPGGYHHDQFEMADGNLLVLTQDPARGTVEDMCVLIDRQTGRILKRWDYQQVLPQDTGGSGSQDSHDWFHNNAVWYDKKTNSLTLSGRHQDAVINIDYETGKINWIIGDPEGWPQEMVDKYFFTPVGDGDFDWQYEQHACVVLPDGDIMCFDNGHWRAKSKEKYVAAKDNFSRGVRYRIDTDKMEIRQVWQFGKERGEKFFSTYICNVEYYGEGHYLVHSGGIGTYDGATLDTPPVAFTGDEARDHVAFNSVTVELQDDVVKYEMHVPANFYRAEKLKLYCREDVLSLGKGELLGTLGTTEEFLTIPPAEDGGMVPEKYNIKIGVEEDRLIFKATFEKGQMVLLQFEGAEKTHSYFVPTTKRPFLAMCVGTFLENDPRAVEIPISREGLSGTFKVSLIVDEHRYQTGVTVQI